MARAEIEIHNTRLTIDMPSNMHRLVKAHASLENLSIKDFVMEAIDSKLEARGISTKIPNKKTTAALRYSVKNPQKLKSFDSSNDAVKWLLSDGKSKKAMSQKVRKTKKGDNLINPKKKTKSAS